MKDFAFPSTERKLLSPKNRKFDQYILSEMAHPSLKKYKAAFDDIITSQR